MFFIKTLSWALLYFIVAPLAEFDLFKFSDFGHYKESGFSIGPNMGYAAFVDIVGADSIADIRFVLLALLVNLFIYLYWLNLILKLSKSKITPYFFILLVTMHPYLAVYDFRLTSLIFEKLALIFIMHYILSVERGNLNNRYLLDIIFWTMISLFRNFNLIFMFIYYTFLNRTKHKLGLLFQILFLLLVLYTSGDYSGSMISAPSDYGWGVSNIEEYISSEFHYFAYPALIFLKTIVLFGGREAVFVNGANVFIDSFGTLDSLIVLFLAVTHIFGIFVAFRYLFAAGYSKKLLYLLIPILLPLISVSHLRYFSPFIVISLLGIALYMEKVFKVEKGVA